MSQKIMVLDCEFNQPSRKCIQIGAAIYDTRTAACYGSFETYVDPGEPITPEITELTGIKDQDVKGAPGIIDAYFMLQLFHEKEKCFKNPLVWGSGVRNDSSALFDEMSSAMKSLDVILKREPKKLENFMGFRVVDAKTLFQSLMLFENLSYAGGLDASMKRLGLKFEGDKHRALTDARNTFTIWYYLTRLAHDGFKKK